MKKILDDAYIMKLLAYKHRLYLKYLDENDQESWDEYVQAYYEVMSEIKFYLN